MKFKMEKRAPLFILNSVQLNSFERGGGTELLEANKLFATVKKRVLKYCFV